MRTAPSIGALAAVCLLTGCQKEPFYDNAPQQWRFLLATDAPALQLRQEPGGITVRADLYREANGEELPAAVNHLALFRDGLYLLPEAPLLEVLEANTYRRRGRLLLPEVPEGIVFPTATAAYLWYRSAAMLSLVDLLSLEHVRTVPASGRIRALVPAGALLYALQEDSARLMVFDTRTLRWVDSLPVPPRPGFGALRADGSQLLVLSLGSGDDSTAPSPRAPRLSLISLNPLQLQRSIPLVVSAADSGRIRISGLLCTPEDFAYVATSEGLLRIDLRSLAAPRLVQNWRIRELLYRPIAGEFWIVTQEMPPRLILATGTRVEALLTAPLPMGTRTLLPLP